MCMDLFDREQRIYDEAARRLSEFENGSLFYVNEFADLLNEYAKLLRQLRRVTKFSDKTTVNLNSTKLALQEKVNFDALTGIYNWRFMEESLSRLIKTISRSNGFLSVLMLDIDFFKKYNDAYGHSIGDDCLKTVAKTLEQSLSRADDFVARYGGEEFIAVLPNTDHLGAQIIADRMLLNVTALNIPHGESDAAPFVTISIGGTTGSVSASLSGVDFIKRADEALYISKRSGRNRYTFLAF